MKISKKMKRLYSILLAVLFIGTSLQLPLLTNARGINYLQQTRAVGALGNVTNAVAGTDTLTLTIDNGAEPNDDILEFFALKDDLIKTNYRPNGIENSPSTPMIDPNQEWSAVGAVIDAASDPITIKTDKMTVEISRTPARITLKDASNNVLLSEPSTGGIYAGGVRFVRGENDHIYGINSQEFSDPDRGILRDDNIDRTVQAGQQGNAGGPFMWSTSGYGILIDSDGGYPYSQTSSRKLEFYYGDSVEEGRRWTKENVELYLMTGEPKEIMTSYADVTGSTPMMPKWSLGFSNFEWGINEQEFKGYIDTYRAKNIPIDSYGFDYDWKFYGDQQNGGNYGEFKWNTNNFPSAADETLKNEMDARGIKMIGITKPRIVTQLQDGTRTQQYNDAEANNYWYPGHQEYQDYFIPVMVRSIDPYNPAERTWWWEHSEDPFNKGIVGWWNDETDKVSSGSAQYWFGNFTTGFTSQAMYDGQRQYTNNNQRVWQTARTYYPGAQRYATTLWSGDIGIQWKMGDVIPWANGIIEQPSAMLAGINLGQTKWGMDTGGFNHESGQNLNPSPELYTRWMQFSSLVPMFRVHGNDNQQRQPWFYGGTAEELAKTSMLRRYSMIPYMYAYERQAYEEGLGLVQPLIFNYPDDENVAGLTNQWMFGDYLLVAPVLEPGVTSRSIYLPEGTWTDYAKGTVYTGGQTISYPINAVTWTDVPMFIKAGAIIPTQKPQDYVGQEPVQTIYVDVFADTQLSSFSYYDDDGNTYNYENGQYMKQLMEAQLNSGTYNFTVGAKEGSFTADVQYYIAKLHGTAATSVTSNGTALTSVADLKALENNNGEAYAVGQDVYGPVTYVKVQAGQAAQKSIQASGGSVEAASVSAAEIVSENAVVAVIEDVAASENTAEAISESTVEAISESTVEAASENTAEVTSENAVEAVSDSYSYEFEDGSLFANTEAQQPTASDTYVSGLNSNGAGVTLYTQVSQGGDYDTVLEYANNSGSNQKVSIFINGVYFEDSPVLPSNGSWNNQTVELTLPLEAGYNSITFEVVSDNSDDASGVRFDKLDIPFDPEVIKVEAESAQLSGGPKMNDDHWYYSGAGFVDNLVSVGARVDFTVEVPSAGDYQLNTRYANGSGTNQSLDLYINNTLFASEIFTSPAQNWNVWADDDITVTLKEGINTLSYRYTNTDTGNVNLDRFLVSANPITHTVESERNLLDDGGFERNSSLSENWISWNPTGQASAFGIDSGSTLNPPSSPKSGLQSAYFYLASPYQQSIKQTVAATPGSAYKVGAWVKSSDTAPTVLRMEVTDYDSTTGTFINIPADGTWHYVHADSITAVNSNISVGFYVNSPGGTTVHIDDVTIELVQ